MKPGKLDEMGRRVLDRGRIRAEEALDILLMDDSQVFELLAWSDRLRRDYAGNKVHLCAIINAKCGACPEDCAFCSQSSHHDTGIDHYNFVNRQEVIEAAKQALLNNARCLGIVAAWRGIKKGKMLDAVCDCIEGLAESKTVRPDASLGLIDDESVAQRLRDAGLEVYNHNLEAARSYFPKICSTHSYDDRVRTIRILKMAGIKVCSGGIIGMGESLNQRVELAFELCELEVDTVPLNFLHRIPGTPLESAPPLGPLEILKTIAMFRFVLPGKNILVAGGREVNLGDLQPLVFAAGATGILVGNYLTTSGRSAEDDLKMIEDLGLTPAR